MLLRDLVDQEKDMEKWSVYDRHGSLIAMTDRELLLQLCEEKRPFQRTISSVNERSADIRFISVALK